jgi:hypothetical protein
LLAVPYALACLATVVAAAELPANQWVKVADEGIGDRTGTCLIWVPPLRRYLAFGGKQSKRGPQPYSEMTFSLDEKEWVNWFPKGKHWGGRTGPAKAPGFKRYRDGFHKDVKGNFRPVTTPDYGLYLLGFQHAWDRDRGRLIVAAYGTTVEYDPVARAWKHLKPKRELCRNELTELDLPGRAPTWAQCCYDPVNKEVLLFGGANTYTESGSAGTWVYSIEKNTWTKLNPGSKLLRALCDEADGLRAKMAAAVAACRNRYYRTELAATAKKDIVDVVRGWLATDMIEALAGKVEAGIAKADGYEKRQLERANADLTSALDRYQKLLAALDGGVTSKRIQAAEAVGARLRDARVSLSPEPPPRCYAPMTYDPASQKILLFGGYALDRVLADTWLYDPATRTWEQRRPEVSPPPRLSHGTLYLPKSGKLVVVGGQTSDFPGRESSFSAIIPDAWTYDVAANQWTLVARWPKLQNQGPFPKMGSGCMLKDHREFVVGADDVILTIGSGDSTWACRLDPSEVDMKGTAKYGALPGTEATASNWLSPLHFDTKAPPPDPEAVEKELANLPVNKWGKRPAGGLGIPVFAYSTVAFDTDRDQILCWTGGHGTYHGTAVHRYSLATDRWHIDYHVQQPLTYGYFSTKGPYAYGFRPWMGVHPWGSDAYDPVLKRLVVPKRLTYLFDPGRGDWDRPPSASAGLDGWNAVACSTPRGVCSYKWARRGESSWLYRLDAETRRWVELPVRGDKLLKGAADRCGITYDSKRNRLVIFNTRLKGDVQTYDLKSGRLVRHKPDGKENANGAFLREMEYIPGADVVLYAMGQCWDPEVNRWRTLELDTKVFGKRSPGTSSGLAYDPKRGLVWLVRGYQGRGVYVLKLDAEKTGK